MKISLGIDLIYWIIWWEKAQNLLIEFKSPLYKYVKGLIDPLVNSFNSVYCIFTDFLQELKYVVAREILNRK